MCLQRGEGRKDFWCCCVEGRELREKGSYRLRLFFSLIFWLGVKLTRQSILAHFPLLCVCVCLAARVPPMPEEDSLPSSLFSPSVKPTKSVLCFSRPTPESRPPSQLLLLDGEQEWIEPTRCRAKSSRFSPEGGDTQSTSVKSKSYVCERGEEKGEKERESGRQIKTFHQVCGTWKRSANGQSGLDFWFSMALMRAASACVARYLKWPSDKGSDVRDKHVVF